MPAHLFEIDCPEAGRFDRHLVEPASEAQVAHAAAVVAAGPKDTVPLAIRPSHVRIAQPVVVPRSSASTLVLLLSCRASAARERCAAALASATDAVRVVIAMMVVRDLRLLWRGRRRLGSWRSWPASSGSDRVWWGEAGGPRASKQRVTPIETRDANPPPGGKGKPPALCGDFPPP